MCLRTLVKLCVLNLLLKSVSSLDLRNVRHVNDWATREPDVLPVSSKKQVSGSDPWSLCPHTMERVDCFYEYLRVYARLRKDVEYSNSVSVRNIGKRWAIQNKQAVI
ncbi:hypothetical protein BsWGS_18782 [Bradybaena similaris]